MFTISKKSLSKFALLGLIILAILVLLALLISNPPVVAEKNNIGKPVAELNGKQLISITAKAGFTPNSFEVAADKSTILRVSTKNTFDCTSTISIPILGINKTLPFSGVTDIELPPQTMGSTLTGTCSMGMYSFTINFT